MNNEKKMSQQRPTLQHYVPMFEDDILVYNEPVNVATLIQAWTEMSNYDFADSANKSITVVEQQIKKMMDLDDDTLKYLSDRCSEERLYCGSEDQLKHQSYGWYPENIDLMSCKLQKIDLKKRLANAVYKNFVCHQQRVRDLFTHILSPLQKEPSAKNRISTPDAILQVALYKPARRRGCYISRHLSVSNANLEIVYAVLGQQKLTELRDHIRCVNDVLVTGDYSDNPDLDINLCAWDVFKSGTFFIENVFYDDMRQPENIKYSKEIVEWGAEAGIEYQCKIMEETKFNELTVRIGCPYLYLHQGNCEHLVVFSDVRMVHPHDNLDINDFPCLIQRTNKRRTICNVCVFDSSRWRTVESEHALESTSFFCDTCFRSLHYDKDGKKLGNFKAYKYFDEHTVI